MSTISDGWLVGNADNDTSARLSTELGISSLTARILVSRGFTDPASAHNFLNNTTLKMYDPFLLADMDKAVVFIKDAVRSGRRICVYGDYDVDGVTATTLLSTYLRSRGANCTCFIPERISEGYGLNSEAIKTISRQCDVIITVDTGITAVEEVEYARSLGVDVVITDHHSCRDVLPAAVAVVDPCRVDDSYPYKALAGVGVVFKLVCALEGNSAKVLEEYAELVAIGTIADVMPLTDENRLIVSAGLSLLEHTKRKGFAALMKKTGVLKRGKRITASAISFAIAPRLNAAGRIASATLALKLLMAEDDESADAIAERLCEINKLRQQTEQRITAEAAKQIAAYRKDASAYVLASDNWHQGVIGVVASKISEKYHTPAILFSFSGDIARGSGRSVSGFSLMDALSKCGDLLVEYGGHELAAGLTIERKNLPEFKKRFEKLAEEALKGRDTVQPLNIDCELRFDEITVGNAAELLMLEPFGLGNPVPLFILKNAVIEDIIPVSDDRHIRLRVRNADGTREASCMYFGMSHSEFPFCRGDMCELACSIEVNEYNGSVTPCVLVRAVRPCEDERLAIYRSRGYYDSIYSGAVSALPSGILPTLEDFRLVFRVLRRELGGERKRVSVRYIKRRIELTEGEKTNLCALKIIIDVLTEFGLVDCLRIRSNDVLELKLLPYSKKVDLEKSMILKKVKESIEKEGELHDSTV